MTLVVLFDNGNGRVPVLEFLDTIRRNQKLLNALWSRIDSLRSYGHELQRPLAATLGDGVYELRARAGRIQARLLYFFDGTDRAVLVSGFLKTTAQVPRSELERARAHRTAYLANPTAHTHRRR